MNASANATNELAEAQAVLVNLLPQLLGSPSGILKLHLNHYIPSPSRELIVQR